MPLKDPPRLLDSAAGAPDYLRDALDAGRADVPRTDQLARLAQRLPIDAPPPNGTGSPPRGPLTTIPSAVPGAIVGAVLGLAVIGLHALFTRAEAPPTVDRGAPTAILAPAATAPVYPERAARDAANPPPAMAPVRAVAAPAVTAAPGAEPSPRSADQAANTAPIAVVVLAGGGPDLAVKPSGSDVGAGPAIVDTETEIQLLQRAQDALGRGPAQALDLINRHAARFPGSNLGQEREVMAVDALVRLGRVGEARARAAAFAARFPTSAHLRRLAALVPSAGIDR